MNDWVDPALLVRWTPEVKSALQVVAVAPGAWLLQWLLLRVIRRGRARFAAERPVAAAETPSQIKV